MQEKNISFNNFEQCIKCTICTAYCPVVAVNPLYPGPKQAGPDGERLRLKNKYFFDENLKYCMNCKRCEVACPSGVKIADLIHSARRRFSTATPGLRDRLLASTDFMGKMARPFAPVVNFMVVRLLFSKDNSVSSVLLLMSILVRTQPCSSQFPGTHRYYAHSSMRSEGKRSARQGKDIRK